MHAPQSVVVAVKYFPAGHVMHDDEPAGYAYVGAVHATQSLALVEASANVVVPARHAPRLACSVFALLLYCPLGTG